MLWQLGQSFQPGFLLAYDTWGEVGTPLPGDWKRRLRQPVPAVADLLGKSFRLLPENQSYPLAGILVEVAVIAPAPAIAEPSAGATA
jgi:hypothetical protein